MPSGEGRFWAKNLYEPPGSVVTQKRGRIPAWGNMRFAWLASGFTKSEGAHGSPKSYPDEPKVPYRLEIMAGIKQGSTYI